MNRGSTCSLRLPERNALRYSEREMANHQPSSASDRLGEKLVAAAVATIGHGLYLAYKYVRHGRVNDVSVGILAFMAAVTTLGVLYYVYLRRVERQRSSPWRVEGDAPLQ